MIVCFPYKFTLLSNGQGWVIDTGQFVSPTNLHCSQTIKGTECAEPEFVSPTNLHCSQTPTVLYTRTDWFVSPTNLHCSQTCTTLHRMHCVFVSPTNLHCSQTNCCQPIFFLQFVSPTNLHCSQTRQAAECRSKGLFPLRIYTALKPQTSNCPRKISAKYLRNIHSLLETLLF